MASNTDEARSVRRGVAHRMVQVLGGHTLWALLFFGAAGSFHVPRGWVYIGLTAALLLANFVVLMRTNKEVIAARSKVRRGTKAFDKVFGLFFIAALLAMPVVAGLDAVRFGWTSLPLSTLWIGIPLLVLGNVPIVWSMAVNRHLEKTVRLQEERDHRVVSDGPYRFVRHPMYVGVILQHLSVPLVLGSAWAFIPVALAILFLVIRTSFEDRTLQRELTGYLEFTKRTRYRLLPHVW